MTVKEFLNCVPKVKEISFIHDNARIETIDTSESGSYRAIKAHYDEKITRIFAIGEDRFRIDSK